MWHAQVRLVHALSAEADDVQIERPWSPTHETRATGALLDSLQVSEQHVRRKLRLEGNHLVEEVWLRHGPDGRCLFDAGRRDDST